MNSKWLIIFLAIALSACSSNKSKNEELSEQEYYQQAKASLDKKSFMIAIERLQLLESRYPFGRYAEQAQLEMIYAYFMLSDHDKVLSLTERFIRLHPLHEQADYAYYLRALATYEMGFGLVERYFEHDVARRDPTPLHDAFYYFSELLTRFPDSPYTTDAHARMIYIKERLASHEITAARFLMKRHSFVAAANRATAVVQNYQRTPAVAEALALQVEAFGQLKMKEEAGQALQLLKLNHPDYWQLKNGKFVDSGLAMTDRRSALNIISFGLID